MIRGAQALWRAHGARVQSALGLWLVSRFLTLIEWRFRIEAML